jgi:hypothetical protein
MACEMRLHANERLEIHTFPPEAWLAPVAAAKGTLGGDDGLDFIEAVDPSEREGDLGERCAFVHGLDGAMATRELAAATGSEPSRTFFEQ